MNKRKEKRRKKVKGRSEGVKPQENMNERSKGKKAIKGRKEGGSSSQKKKKERQEGRRQGRNKI